METEQKKTQEFRSVALLSAEEMEKKFPFPKPNTDGFFERMEKRDKQFKQQAVEVEQN
jgi:hypothetical protein